MKIIVKPARNLLCEVCANLINFIRKIIFSREFFQQSRYNSADFSRNRSLPFTSFILLFSNFLKSSYQPELNKFFKILSGSTVAQKMVSKAALCKARKKIKPEAFTLLNQEAIGYFNQHFHPRTWHGFFLRSVDGSAVKLPATPDIADHFGVWNPRQGGPVPMARISQMFDPLNKVTTHALIGPKSTGERDLAASHFKHLSLCDLVLLDRGYPPHQYPHQLFAGLYHDRWPVEEDYSK